SEYLLASFEAMAATHGSLDAYLQACGLEGDRRKVLRRRLLTAPGSA
ncbi:MAG: tyrosine-protein phosphatase, partial [Nevskia sp.]|nr:tyrosine-protein phosphatase [Nevskia sp.]